MFMKRGKYSPHGGAEAGQKEEGIFIVCCSSLTE
jgi:hypothetical protein